MERRRKPGTFLPGDPRAGRKPGSVNRATKEIRDLAQRLLTDRAYQKALKERLIAGTAGRIEELLYLYAWGKPLERIERVDAAPGKEPGDVLVIEVGRNGERG
jgi:hypothetical protein